MTEQGHEMKIPTIALAVLFFCCGCAESIENKDAIQPEPVAASVVASPETAEQSITANLPAAVETSNPEENTETIPQFDPYQDETVKAAASILTEAENRLANFRASKQEVELPFPVFREWSDATSSFRVKAKVESVDSSSVTLLREDNGQAVTVRRDRLSESDRQFLEIHYGDVVAVFVLREQALRELNKQRSTAEQKLADSVSAALARHESLVMESESASQRLAERESANLPVVSLEELFEVKMRCYQSIEWSPGDGILQIDFEVRENLTNSLTRTAAEADVFQFLGLLKSSNTTLPYKEVAFSGNALMIDAYGNEIMMRVLLCYFNRSDIDRMNFSNLDYSRAMQLTTDTWWYRSFK
jgi:hypothetical protein